MDASDVNLPVDLDTGHLNQLRNLPDPSEAVRLPPEVLESVQASARAVTDAARVQIHLPAMVAAMSPVLTALASTRSALNNNIDWTAASPALTALADVTSTLHDNIDWAAASPALTALADVTSTIHDLSWLQGSLSSILAVTERRDWFTQQVQTLYTSDWMDELIREPPTEPPANVPTETAAELEASAAAFQEQVQYLPLAEQQRLFLAFMGAVGISLCLMLAVVVQDNDTAKDVLASVGDIAGVASTVVALSLAAWASRTQQGDNNDS
ncbi:hypothetical protein [Streptomyces sp. NPDC058674]|uniref:hypothetical protein n=1 Tax=Streptomyces sp. NPDC058674 TaxID=3346592 RepID=UPI003653124A